MLNLQTAEMPKDERTLIPLARKVGLNDSAEFRLKNSTFLLNVRRIFESVLDTGATSSELTLATIVGGNVRLDAVARVLVKYGFRDTHKAAKNLSTLLSGSSFLEMKEFDVRARDAFRDIVETMFDEIAQSPVPDMTLHDLSMIAISHPFPEQFYTQLKEENFRKLVLTVCAVSPRFSKGLSRHPLLLEALTNDPQSLVGATMENPLPTASLIDLKNQEELRSGIRYVLGVTHFDQLAAELTQLADVILTSAFVEELKSVRRKRVSLAVFALGKYGSREINFDSDLDLLFVSEAKDANGQERLEKIARGVLQRVTSFSEKGKLYDADARLRPEGRSAPLVVDRNAYAEYLRNRSSLWERQSLTRLRWVAGDEKLGREVTAMIERFVYETPLPGNWVREIVSMRRKTETRSRVTGSLLVDIKLGAGGMVDIEFLAQMLQLKYGTDNHSLRQLHTCDIVHQLLEEKPERRDLLISAYQLYRTVETLLRITLEERGTILPEGEKLEVLERCFGKFEGGSVAQRCSSTMRNVRAAFLELTDELEINLEL